MSMQVKCTYNEDEREWTVPTFGFKDRRVQMPKSNTSTMHFLILDIDIIHNDKKNRILDFNVDNPTISKPPRILDKQYTRNVTHLKERMDSSGDSPNFINTNSPKHNNTENFPGLKSYLSNSSFYKGTHCIHNHRAKAKPNEC